MSFLIPEALPKASKSSNLLKSPFKTQKNKSFISTDSIFTETTNLESNNITFERVNSVYYKENSKFFAVNNYSVRPSIQISEQNFGNFQKESILSHNQHQQQRRSIVSTSKKKMNKKLLQSVIDLWKGNSSDWLGEQICGKWLTTHFCHIENHFVVFKYFLSSFHLKIHATYSV